MGRSSSGCGAEPEKCRCSLHLALQLLLDHLHPSLKTLDAAIAAAYANDTPEGIVIAMDYVRVTGNGAVHDRQVQMDEDPRWFRRCSNC